ncbi:MAG: hypothetical protein PHU95_03640 [Candidatus Thermoplasmatota archaeon]|nr:hypothetical protein [Candidatus Thermoplasmatota archaeon]MDD5778521.1 hypothetical protein [Candidatus Thermoplasmatota archaeon]
MDVLPLVHVEQGTVIEAGRSTPAAPRFRELHKEHDEVYVMDLDGIHHNRSHLDVYKKVSRKPFLWIDALPRRVEDVIDLVVAGAKRITVGEAMGDESLRSVRDIYEGDLYLRGSDAGRAAATAARLGCEGIVLMQPGKIEWDLPTWGIYPDQQVVKKIA